MVKVKVRNESKHERFVRIATNRTQKVLDGLRILGNCANTQTYEYTKEEVEIIFKSIRTAMEEVRHKFAIKLNEKKLFKLQ